MTAPSGPLPAAASGRLSAPVPPGRRGGWWHHYVCPAHGVELDHGDLLGGTFPGGRCPHGCLVDTAEVRDAWAALAHQACARRLRLLARRGAHREALAGLRAYGRAYERLTAGRRHEDAAAWMVRGRLFQQALTETIWATSVADAAWSLAEAGTGGLGDVLPLLDGLADLAGQAREALVARGEFRSNYVAWFNAAGALCAGASGAIRGDGGGAAHARWLDGPRGVWAHALAATGEDGWEWEGSTYYHGFVLRAYLLAMRGLAPGAAPPAALSRIRDMAGVLERIATPGGLLPALHDGPYRRAGLAAEWLELCALVRLIFGIGPRLAAVADGSAAAIGPGHDRLEQDLDEWFATAGGSHAGSANRPATRGTASPHGEPPAAAQTRVTDEPPPTGAATVFPDAGYAVLSGQGLHAVVDFGPHGGSHGHLDKLALYLYGDRAPWQPDPGQVPYGHAVLRAYYRSTAAHPTFRVDGRDQDECAGRLLEATGTAVTVAADGAYPGVRARRHVAFLAGGALLDVLAVRAGRPRRISAGLRPDVRLDVSIHGDRIRTRWPGEQTLHGCHACDPAAVPLARPGPGPADDPQRTRPHLDWTADHVKGARFVSIYRVNRPVDDADVRAGLAIAAGLDGWWWR